MDCDTISLPPSAKQRAVRCIPTAPRADISSDQRQLSPLCLNQRETLERAHRWPAPDKQRYTASLRWLQTWLWAETENRIAHDGYSVVQNPPASFVQDAHFLNSILHMSTITRFFLLSGPLTVNFPRHVTCEINLRTIFGAKFEMN